MDLKRGWKIMVVAGEASGDLLGGELLRAIRLRYPQVRFMGVGGPWMKEEGLEGVFNVNHLSVIGLAEVIFRLPVLIKVFRHLVGMMDRERPDLLITIDLPDFNFLLAGRARKRNIPVLHYVGPQVWAWRSGRTDRLASLLDHLLVLFPFEPPLYAHTGLPVTFVGHPLVGRTKPWQQRSLEDGERMAVRGGLGVKRDGKLVAILPGSRRGEIKRLLPIMIRVCERLKQKDPDIRFVLALAQTLTKEEILAYWPKEVAMEFMPEVPIRAGATYDLVASSDAALVASGTATLETALLGTPMVVCYRVNPLTYAIGKRVVRVPFFSLVNLVAQREVVKERLQNEATPERLSEDLWQLLRDEPTRSHMLAGYGMVREKLAHAHKRPIEVVDAILENLDQGESDSRESL